MDRELQLVGRRHGGRLRPRCVAKAQPGRADRGRPAQVHVEVAGDIELAARLRFHLALDRAPEPVPVPYQRQHHEGDDDQPQRQPDRMARGRFQRRPQAGADTRTRR